jgi:hypothetical protein
VPGSEGLFSPRWSPNGRYLLAIPNGKASLVMYDFRLRTWQQLASTGAAYPDGRRTVNASTLRAFFRASKTLNLEFA